MMILNPYSAVWASILLTCPYYWTKMFLDRSKLFLTGPKRFSPRSKSKILKWRDIFGPIQNNLDDPKLFGSILNNLERVIIFGCSKPICTFELKQLTITKGQIISEQIFGVLKFSKKSTKCCQDFCPSL